MTGRRRPRVLAATVAVLAGLLLAGCVSIPSDGPVVDARKVDEVSGPAVAILPPGPTPGASPSALIRGFLFASEAFVGDHEKAREYLLEPPGPRVRWLPDTSVVIYLGRGMRLTWTRDGVTRTEPAPAPGASSSPSSGSSSASSPSSSASSSASSPSSSASSASSASSPSSSGSSSPTVAGTAPGRPAGTAAGATATAAGRDEVADAPPALGETVTVTVTVPVVGRINDAGEYTASPPGDLEIRTFVLTGTADGWRISRLQDGILITQYDFELAFKPLPLYWSDPTGKYLVPDVRWFPVANTSSTTPAEMVSALLGSCCSDHSGNRAPAAWLRPGVVTGAPPNTKPTVNGVKVVDGVATVDLTRQAREANALQRLMLKSQLEQTLAGVRQTAVTIGSVTVTVEQQVFEMQVAPSLGGDARDPDAGTAGPQPPPDVEDRLVALDTRGAIVRVDGGKVVPVKGLTVSPAAGNSSPAAESGGAAYALLTEGRSRLVYAVPSGPTTTLVWGSALLPPSFDPFGWVWTAQEQAGNVVLAGLPGSGVLRVQAPWLDGARMRALRISREGARAVLVAEANGVTEALVCSVVRDPKGRPIALGAPLRVLTDAQQVISATWIDQTHVAVLARRAGLPTQPWIVELGGGVEQTSPTDGVSVTAANTVQDLYVTTAGGAVRMWTGSGWQDLPGVRWASMPG
ncbi:MAG TPA: LpqB family beta-propeller domain-containing protein [Kineosporiaceae bacterium]